MPRLFEVPLFVSSPSDCVAERAKILAVVGEINDALGRELGLRIDAFDSSRPHPTVGPYAQAGINEQLQGYEIYVGVWRERRGTPTPAAPSGTEEELRDAVRRYEATRRPLIMAYFYERGAFDDVKNLLKESGRYFHLYANSEQLGHLFRRHIADILHDEYRSPGYSSTVGPPRDEPDVHLTLDVHRPGEAVERLGMSRRVVAVGRSPDVNQIVLTDQRVHREQGLFVWDTGQLNYIDLAGDALVSASGSASGGRHVLNVEDMVTLPGDARIVVRAIVS
jgi:hypothetical protein